MHTNFNGKGVEVAEVVIPRSQVVRIIDGDDELKKNMAGQVLKHNSNN